MPKNVDESVRVDSRDKRVSCPKKIKLTVESKILLQFKMLFPHTGSYTSHYNLELLGDETSQCGTVGCFNHMRYFLLIMFIDRNHIQQID